MEKDSLRIVFMGSPEIAVPALRLLSEAYTVTGVVTQPDRPAGRGKKIVSSAVKVAATELEIPVMQPEKLRNPEAFEQLANWKPDLIVVMAYGQILRKSVLELPKYGCINIHASLLPRWRGASPIQAAILAGDSQTGVTIMKMDPGMDTGPLLAIESIDIDPADTADSLSERISVLGAQLLLSTLPGYLSGRIAAKSQPEDGITYASLIKKQDGLLDFSVSALELERKVRAFNPWPSAFFFLDETMMKIHRAHSVPAEDIMEPGTRILYKDLPAIMTGKGLLVLDEIQCAGKKSMDCKAFLTGNRDWLS